MKTLAFLLALSGAFLASSTEAAYVSEEVESVTVIDSSPMPMPSVGQRKLWGFSWADLLYHVCRPPPHNHSCHHGPLKHVCPCSDWFCAKNPHLPNCNYTALNATGDLSVAGDEENDMEEEGGPDGEGDGDFDGTGADESSSENGVGGGGNWIFSPLAYVLLASAVAGVGLAGAMLMRNRSAQAMAGSGVDDRALTEGEGGSDAGGEETGSAFGGMSNRVGMMIGGAGLAAAGVAGAAIGAASGLFGGGAEEDDQTDDGLQGSVSRRLDVIENGGDAAEAPYYAESVAPSFIEVPSERGDMETVSVSRGGDIEVEGPSRPSAFSL